MLMSQSARVFLFSLVRKKRFCARQTHLKTTTLQSPWLLAVTASTTMTTSYVASRCARLYRDGATCVRCALAEEVPVGNECRRSCPHGSVKLFDAGGNNPWCASTQIALDLAQAGDYELAWAPRRRFPRVFRDSNQVVAFDGTMKACLDACRSALNCAGIFYNFARSRCIGLSDIGSTGRSHPSAFPGLALRPGGIPAPDDLAASLGFRNAFASQPGRRFATALRRQDRIFRLEKVSLEDCLIACAEKSSCKGVYHEALLCHGLRRLGRPDGKPSIGRVYSYAKLEQ